MDASLVFWVENNRRRYRGRRPRALDLEHVGRVVRNRFRGISQAANAVNLSRVVGVGFCLDPLFSPKLFVAYC